MKAKKLISLVLVLLVFTAELTHAVTFPNSKKDLNSFRKTYKCIYLGYRKFGSPIRVSADGDEKPRIITIDKSWKLNAKKRSFTKAEKTGELTINGQNFPPRFINSDFDTEESLLIREHGFVGDEVDYISYYECFGSRRIEPAPARTK